MARYVATINPDAIFPGRTKVMGDIKSLSNKDLSKIREALSRARQVSMTTDICSSKLSMDSYIGVNVHFINTFTRKQQWLEISIENRVWFVLTDSGSNMINGKQVW